ncbi:MAG: hypothetical protein II080_06150, partial [Lachnospiraceae bacterium]|nr:hypothetical protein [Lachnospiraceae bacterium]
DQGSRYYRRAHWIKVVQECLNRPSNITAKQCLKDNGISDKSYYYWLRKLKSEKLSQVGQSLPVVGHDAGKITFVEVPSVLKPMNREICSYHGVSVMAKIRIGDAEIELMDSISDEFLCRLLKAAARYAY